MIIKSNAFVFVVTFPTIPICGQDEVVIPIHDEKP